MQPTVQSEQDKMVPIDTSGDPVEIELKEDNKEQPEVKVEEQQPVVENTQTESQTEEDKDQKLEEYSDNVKRRIDKLTRKMREAERREQAAIEYAKNVKGKMDSLQTSNQNQSELYLVEREKSLTNQKEFAKRAFEAAVNAQDVEKQVAAQQEIARLTIEEERLKVSKQKNEAKKVEAQKVETGGSIEQQFDQQPQQAPIDPKAEAWKEKNDWFGTNRAMTYMAYDIHENLIQEGFDPTSDEYYNEVDSRIRKEFPQQFSNGGDINKPKQRVASAVRTSPSGRRTVKLTPSQVAIAKKLGVPLEEYAKRVKEA